MQTFGVERVRDEVILVGRILLIVLFLVFGWSKLTHYSQTVVNMAHVGAPRPSIAALVAIVAEVFVALAIALGAWTRPLAADSGGCRPRIRSDVARQSDLMSLADPR